MESETQPEGRSRGGLRNFVVVIPGSGGRAPAACQHCGVIRDVAGTRGHSRRGGRSLQGEGGVEVADLERAELAGVVLLLAPAAGGRHYVGDEAVTDTEKEQVSSQVCEEKPKE